MTHLLRTSLLSVAGSVLISSGAFAADVLPVIPAPVAPIVEEPGCTTTGYVEAYGGAGFGYVFYPPIGDIQGIAWGDIAFGGAGRAAIQCRPAFSFQLDAWSDHWAGAWTFYDDGGPYGIPTEFERTTMGIGTHLTFHAGNFLIGGLVSVGADAGWGTFVNVGAEAAFNTEKFRLDAQAGYTLAVLGTAASLDARDYYAQIGAAFYPRPNFSLSANVGGDIYADTDPWYRRTLSWGAKIEFSPPRMPVAFYVGYEGWHWGAGFDTAYDDNFAWEHAVRIGLRFMVGAPTLRALDEAVGLIDENPIYGQAFGPTDLRYNFNN